MSTHMNGVRICEFSLVPCSLLSGLGDRLAGVGGLAIRLGASRFRLGVIRAEREGGRSGERVGRGSMDSVEYGGEETRVRWGGGRIF